MHKDLNIKLDKLSVLANGMAGDLMIGHQLKGTLIHDVEVGKPIQVLRYETNGIQKLGLFCSSNVQKIENCVIYTQNSAWRMTIL